MPRTKRSRKTVFPVIALLVLTSAGFGSITIARGGKAVAPVVVGAAATETERQAAAELGLFLHLVTGAEIPVGHAAAGPGGRLLVGEEAARLADPSFSAKSHAAE